MFNYIKGVRLIEMTRNASNADHDPPAMSLFNQLAGISPTMRVLCVGALDFSDITEITAKKDSSNEPRAFINKCTIKITPGT